MRPSRPTTSSALVDRRVIVNREAERAAAGVAYTWSAGLARAGALQSAEGGVDRALLKLLIVAGVDLRSLGSTFLAPARARSGLPEGLARR